jgi:Tfp pilus assembly protein PilF
MPRLDGKQVGKIARGELKTAQIVDIDADQIAAALMVGHLLHQQGKIQEAQKIFEGLLVLDTKNPFVHSILGSIYQQQERLLWAFYHYSRAIQAFPQDIASLTNRGEIHLRFGTFKYAAADFKAAIDLDPQGENPFANRARLLSRLAHQSLQLVKDSGISAAVEAQNQVKQSIR